MGREAMNEIGLKQHLPVFVGSTFEDMKNYTNS